MNKRERNYRLPIALWSVVAAGALSVLAVVNSNNEDEKISDEARSQDITTLQQEIDAMRLELLAVDTDRHEFYARLPEDCRHNVAHFRTDGISAGISNAEAIAITSEWCGPDFTQAVPIMRDYDQQVTEKQEYIAGREESIMANLGALGVTVPPTTG